MFPCYSRYAAILAFDVKVEREAQELADSLGVRIFMADIIYHLFDKFTAYRDELKKQKQEEYKHVAVFPCKLRIMPQYIFNSRDPIVVGVTVEAGFLKEGTMLCVPSREVETHHYIHSALFTPVVICQLPSDGNMQQFIVVAMGEFVCLKFSLVQDEVWTLSEPGETRKSTEYTNVC